MCTVGTMFLPSPKTFSAGSSPNHADWKIEIVRKDREDVHVGVGKINDFVYLKQEMEYSLLSTI